MRKENKNEIPFLVRVKLIGVHLDASKQEIKQSKTNFPLIRPKEHFSKTVPSEVIMCFLCNLEVIKSILRVNNDL